jgi:hypothetical protein
LGECAEGVGTGGSGGEEGLIGQWEVESDLATNWYACPYLESYEACYAITPVQLHPEPFSMCIVLYQRTRTPCCTFGPHLDIGIYKEHEE